MTKRHRHVPNRTVRRGRAGSPRCTCELCCVLRLSNRQFNYLMMQHALAADNLRRFDGELQSATSQGGA